MIMEHPVLSSFIFLAGAAVLYYNVTRIINAVLPTQYEIVAVTDRDETVRYKILWYGLKLCKAEVEYRREVIEYMGKYISPSEPPPPSPAAQPRLPNAPSTIYYDYYRGRFSTY